MARKPTTRKEAEVACKIVELVEKALEETPDLLLCRVDSYCKQMLTKDGDQPAYTIEADTPERFRREMRGDWGSHE